MIKKTIEYTDFDGNKRKEDFYFHLTEAEVADWEMSVEGGLSKALVGIIKSKDMRQIMPIYKSLIVKSYGVKSPDGRRFIKNDEVRDEFVQTQAFSDLYMKLATDLEEGTNFIKGVMPTFDSEVFKNLDAIIDSTDDVDEIIAKIEGSATSVG
jgi:hypothetical protein